LHWRQLLADAAALLAPSHSLGAVTAFPCCVHAAKVQLAGICLVFVQHLLQQAAAAARFVRPAGCEQLPNLQREKTDACSEEPYYYQLGLHAGKQEKLLT
jgi:predicted alpha/beta hydrolase family esterase